MNKSCLIINVFKFLCFLTAGFMVGFWIYEYQKNEDITLIEVKTLKEADDTLYPEMMSKGALIWNSKIITMASLGKLENHQIYF